MVFDWSQQLRFYADWYSRELDRGNQITASLAVPLSLLSALGAGTAYFLNHRPEITVVTAGVFLFYVLLTLAAASLASATWYLYQTLFPSRAVFRTYKYLPLPRELEALRTQLQQRLVTAQDAPVPGDLRESADDFLRKELVTSIRECIDQNAVVNDLRSRTRFEGIRMTILAAVFLALSALPFFLLRLGD